MRKISAALFIFSVIFFGAHGAFAYTATYKQVMEVPGAEGGTMTHDVWLNEDNMRIESIVDGEKKVIITRKNDIFMYLPARNSYTRLPQLLPGSDGAKNPVEFVKKLKAMDKKESLGTETINGYVCDVYRYRDELSGSIVTVWVWQGKDFPAKMVFAGGMVENSVTFRDIKLDEPIPAEIFELPKDAKEYNPNSLASMFDAVMEGQESDNKPAN
jgi:outer membrane lipoprotein-sorting protein